MGVIPQINNKVAMGGSMSPIRKSFGVNKVQDPRTKTIKELSRIKDQYKQTSNVRSGSGFLSPAE